MEYLELSEFLSNHVSAFLLGAFLSRTMEDKDYNLFYAYTDFKRSSKCDYNLMTINKSMKEKFNKKSCYENWFTKINKPGELKICFYVHNNLNISLNEFYCQIYNRCLDSEWFAADPKNSKEKRDFMRGFFELRACVDTGTNFMSEDLFIRNEYQIDALRKLNLPSEYLNLNIRDLQPEVISGKKIRNPQLRMNIYYYAKEIGFLNFYKAEIFRITHSKENYYDVDDIRYFENIDLPDDARFNTEFFENINLLDDYTSK